MSFLTAGAKLSLVAFTISSLSGTAPALADDDQIPNFSISGGGHDHHGGIRADSHAPIGVMGDHLHKKGEWMLSYRFMTMEMEGNQIGEDNVSPSFIVNNVANPFGMPPTLRVVPTKMRMDMHMLGAMYAPSDSVTLMAMLPILENEMDHVTFAGMNPNKKLGTFTTRSSGIGDLSLSGLIDLYNDGRTKIHFNAGLSLPTGSITQRDNVLSPMNTRPNLRLPYAMQLGTGTWDLLPGITIQSRTGDLSYGAQYKARFHLGDNNQDWSFGDKHELTAWIAYQWAPWISTSLRIAGRTQEEINGQDLNIAAPVQTADPDNYGGERIDLFGGVNFAAQSGYLKGHRFALEFGAPIYQDLNGPQMETDYIFTVGWQKAF